MQTIDGDLITAVSKLKELRVNYLTFTHNEKGVWLGWYDKPLQSESKAWCSGRGADFRIRDFTDSYGIMGGKTIFNLNDEDDLYFLRVLAEL